MRTTATPLLVAALVAALSLPASAAAFPGVIPLPIGFQPEGIAIGGGAVAYAGSLADGDVVRVDLRTGSVERFVDVDDRVAVGLAVDPSGSRLFVAGGPTGQAWVYDTTSGEQLAALALTDPGTFINDVVVTREAAWFTDSFTDLLYRVPLAANGLPTGEVEDVALGGDFDFHPGEFNANGIEATPDGQALLVIQSVTATLYHVDPDDGEATVIDIDGDLANGDGILLTGRRHLLVVRNRDNMVAEVTLDPSLASGAVTATTTDPDFDVPTTIARLGSRQYVVNARFGTAGDPSTADYSMVRVGD